MSKFGYVLQEGRDGEWLVWTTGDDETPGLLLFRSQGFATLREAADKLVTFHEDAEAIGRYFADRRAGRTPQMVDPIVVSDPEDFAHPVVVPVREYYAERVSPAIEAAMLADEELARQSTREDKEGEGARRRKQQRGG